MIVEWFNNVLNWIITNKDEIIITVTSSQFIGLFVTIIELIKQRKVNKNATSKNVTLSNNVKELSDNLENATTELANIQKENADLKLQLSNIVTFCEESIEKGNVLLTKLDAVLEVQSIVYTSLKDNSQRQTVANILTNAKYAETSQRAKLKEQLKSLQEELDSKTKEVNKYVQNVVHDVENVLGVAETVSEQVIRG